ncbi:MAG: TonB-dependent receptor domain-containing protein [Rhodanobacter sp.]
MFELGSKFRGSALCGAVLLALNSGAAWGQVRTQVQVPAESLALALKAVAQQTGTNILFTPEAVAGMASHAVGGQLSAQEAVSQLLTGTPLEAAPDGAGGLVIRPKQKGATEPAANSPKATTTLQTVIVTGSRIPQPETERLQPTVVTTDKTIADSGEVNLGNVIRKSPIFQSFDQNSGDQAGHNGSDDVGVTFANLYNLGSQRTLTLINGKRVVGAESGSGANSGLQVDISSIPTGLVDRIETISVGGAPIYGSDAIAGTVNIILKDNYEGLQVDTQGGVTQKGDGANGRAQVLFGSNFDEGRGNITLSAAYARQNQVSASDRNFQEPLGFAGSLTNPQVNVPVTGGAYIFSSQNGRPSSFFSPGGVDPTTGAPKDFFLNASGQPLTFDRGGNLVPFVTGPGAATVVAGVALLTIPPGSDTDTTRRMAPVISPSERHYFNAMGHYDFSDHLTAFMRFSYAQTQASFADLAPLASALGGFPDPNTGPLAESPNNPFLTPAARAYFMAHPNPVTGTTFYLNRELTDITSGLTDIRQNTWTFQTGLEGDFDVWNRTFNWDFTVSDGRTTRDQTATMVQSARFGFANDAVYATAGANGLPGSSSTILPTPAGLSVANFTYDAVNHLYRENGTGNLITCRVRVTGGPAGASPSDIARCAPYNPFGTQNPQDALNYLRGTSFQNSQIEQQYVQGNINATLFDLPAGPLQWAGGFEARKEQAAFNLDAGLQNGTFYLGYPQGTPNSGHFLTKEIYTEIKAPLVDADMLRSAFGVAPFKKLEFEGAIRHMDDSITGGDVTWTLGGRLEINDDLTFRGNRTRSVRQPAIAELFAGTTPSNTSVTDPCAIGVIATGPSPANRRANCEQAVISAGLATNTAQADSFLSSFTTPLTTINGTFSGNPHLKSEIADSWTAGIVLTPTFLPKFVATVDWVNIDIKGAISALNGTGVADACYDSASLANLYCAALTRNPANFNIVGFNSFEVNQDVREFAGLTAQFHYNGIDLSQLAGQESKKWGTLSLNGLFFYLDHDRSSVGGTGLVDTATQTGSERYRAQLGLNYDIGKLDAGWQVNYYSSSKIDPNNPSLYLYNNVAAYWLHDLTVSYALTPKFHIQAIVNNVFNVHPPFNTTSYEFDRLGRRFEIGFKADL